MCSTTARWRRSAREQSGFPVAATINGYKWRSTIVRMRGEFLLGLSKEVRGHAQVEADDEVEVALELDRVSERSRCRRRSPPRERRVAKALEMLRTGRTRS